MRQSLWLDLLKLIAIGMAIWAVFTFIPIFPDAPKLEFSIDYEEKLGKIIVEDILTKEQGFEEVENPSLDSAMNIITSRLTDNIGSTDYQYKFRVVKNPEVNAFTLPGGNIFIFTGLIEFSEHPEEVAAVLAHEIGHVEKRHVVSKLVKELGLAIIIGILTNGDPVVITEIGRTVLSTVFDREQEREADQFGLDLLAKSNISPQSMATFFRRLEREKGTYSESLEILMTHPHVNSRIKASMEYKTPEDFKSQGFGIDWKAVKEDLREAE
jgi:beta-barrel assembly-enhancing protease